MKAFACPWCGRTISTKRSNLPTHLTFGGQKCVAIGTPTAQAASHRELIDREQKRKSAERLRIRRAIKRLSKGVAS